MPTARFLAIALVAAACNPLVAQDFRSGRELHPVQKSLPPAGIQRPLIAGTVAHWRFAGKAGAVAGDETSVPDMTGRYKAEIFGEPMYRSVEGRDGLEFNGGNDRIFIKDDPAFTLTQSLTLEAVVRYDGPAPDAFQYQIVFRGDDRSGMDPWCLYVRPDGRLLFQIMGGEREYVQLLSPRPLPTGKLISAAGTLDGDSGEMRLYIDRQLVAMAVTGIRPLAQLDEHAKPGVSIGNIQSDTYPEAFNGMICEVRICDRALAPAEMLRAKEKTGRGKPRRPTRAFILDK